MSPVVQQMVVLDAALPVTAWDAGPGVLDRPPEAPESSHPAEEARAFPPACSEVRIQAHKCRGAVDSRCGELWPKLEGTEQNSSFSHLKV